MPKLKTHSGAKKRFRLTATGKVRAKRAMARHILTKKTRSNKRKKKSLTVMAKCDAAFIKKMIQK